MVTIAYALSVRSRYSTRTDGRRFPMAQPGRLGGWQECNGHICPHLYCLRYRMFLKNRSRQSLADTMFRLKLCAPMPEHQFPGISH